MPQSNEQKLKGLLSEARKTSGNIPHKDADELLKAWQQGYAFGACPKNEPAPAK